MWTWKTARRVIVAVVGGTVVLIGVLLGPLPFVPAIVIIPLGLAILATEFIWAKRLLKKVKEEAMSAAGTFSGGNRPSGANADSEPAMSEKTANEKGGPETEGRTSDPQ